MPPSIPKTKPRKYHAQVRRVKLTEAYERIIDLLAKLFWRQNQTDHSNRRYYEARKQQPDFAFADRITPTSPKDPKAEPKKTKTPKRRTQRASASGVQHYRDVVESSSEEPEQSSFTNTTPKSLVSHVPVSACMITSHTISRYGLSFTIQRNILMASQTDQRTP